jgi:NAD+ diphosphatase
MNAASPVRPRFCTLCGEALVCWRLPEDGGTKSRLRCPACGWTHWNNPTPVLAAVIEYHGQLLLARNAAWTGRQFALITGFMEAGETPEAGITREIKEETHLDTQSLNLLGVYEASRMNQVIIAYHASTSGVIRLSAELAEYQLFAPHEVQCWPAGTRQALAS